MNTCAKCYTTFNILESADFLAKIGLTDYPPSLLEYCPKCLAEVYLASLGKTDNINNTYTPKPSSQQKPISNYQNTNIDKPLQIPQLTPFTKSLAIILSVLSVFILIYSLILRYFPQITLPDFPFYTYVVIFSLLVFFIRVSKGAGIIFLVIIVANFFTPHFRNLFYSYFGSTWIKIVFTLFFIYSFLSLTNLFYVFFLNSFLPKWGTITQNKLSVASLKALIPTFILYFAVMSPFYLGAIQPGGDPEVTLNKVQTDPIFDSLTNITQETADVEIARQYFNEGKEAADLGTIEELNRSFQFYQKAIELVPQFSTAYAEIAYSYGAISRIKKSIDKKSEESKTYMNKARIALDVAKERNPNNYTIYAVESINEFISDNEKAAKENLNKALEMAGSSGLNERMLQAMSYLGKSKVQSLSYLITIKDSISPNSAEIHNLLAVKYYQIGNLEKTKEMAERAILLSPKYDEPYFNIALGAEKRIEKTSIYDRIVEMQSDYASKAEHFKKLIKWQYGFRITFWIMFSIFLFRFLYLAGSVMMKKINPEKLGLMLIRSFFLFTVIFGSFELYIHYLNPVNSLTHLFPVSFPIF